MMESLPYLTLELIYMIFLQLLVVDPPRIFHLKRRPNITTGREDITFYGNLKTTQPLVTRLSPWSRDWAKKHYVLAFTSIAHTHGRPSGGLWIRPSIDLVYIDTAFCATSLNPLSRVSMWNVSQIAVDATLLNDRTGRDGFVSVMDELLTYFSNVKNMVFMVPTRPNPRLNRYQGLRLVDEQEEEHQKQLAFSSFYHCGAIVTNPFMSAIMFSRSPEAGSSLIRYRLHKRDRLKRALVSGTPFKVILFQRQGMRTPKKNTVTGPFQLRNRALSKIASRMHPEPIPVSKLLELVEESKTV